jgi:ADP-ribose pyrophosphatase YjhB (NUDIX family)
MSTMPERLPVARYCQVCGYALVERLIPSERRTRLQCEGCGHIHYVNPRVVCAIIVSHKGRVLLQRRAVEPRAGYWTFPGGFLEMGEQPLAGAVRETAEETGVHIEDARLLGVYGRPHVGIVLVVYSAESASDAAVVGDAESSEVAWFAPDDIPWDAIAFETTEQALREWMRQPASAVEGSTT